MLAVTENRLMTHVRQKFGFWWKTNIFQENVVFGEKKNIVEKNAVFGRNFYCVAGRNFDQTIDFCQGFPTHIE